MSQETFKDLQSFKNFLSENPQYASEYENISKYYLGKGYDPDIGSMFSLMLSICPDPTLVIDMGGNEGDYVAETLARCPQAKIHTFEASPTNVSKLQNRFVNNQQVTVVPYGVSDRAETTLLYTDEIGNGGGSISKRDLRQYGRSCDLTETINTMRFEDYWKDQLARQKIDFIKMDIEGHEYAALQGFGESLNHIGAIQYEFGGCNIDSRVFFRDIYYLLTNANFAIYRITPNGLLQLNGYSEFYEDFSFQNCIAVNKNR